MFSTCDPWAHCEHLVSGITMFSACSHWVLRPLPPVYAADSDDSLGTTDRSCGGAPSDPEMGSGEGEEVSDHSRASSIDGGARSVQPVADLPSHAYCSFVAGRRYSDRGPIVLDG